MLFVCAITRSAHRFSSRGILALLTVNGTELKLVFPLHGESKKKLIRVCVCVCVFNTNRRRLPEDGTEILYSHCELCFSFEKFALLVKLHEILECLLYHNRKGNKTYIYLEEKICYFCDLIKNLTVPKKKVLP